MATIIYASRKLKAQEKQLLEHALDGLCFSCGSLLQDAELPEGLQDVSVCKININTAKTD